MSTQAYPRVHPVGWLHLRPYGVVHRPRRQPRRLGLPLAVHQPRRRHHRRHRHQPDRLHLAARQRHHLERRCRRRRVQVDRQPDASTAITVGTDPTSSSHGQSHPDPWVSLRVSQAWGRASVAVIGHKNAATYYTGTAAGLRRRPAPRCAAIRTTSGAGRSSPASRSSSTSLSPGSRIGGYVTYGHGASRITRNNQTSPGLFGSGNQIAFGVLTDAVYVNGSQPRADHDVGGGRRVRILLDP